MSTSKIEYTPALELTESEETARGQEIARILQLKPARHYNGTSRGKRYSPERYATTHGTKTALGLFRTLQYEITKPLSTTTK